MNGAKYENEPAYNGKKVVVWVVALFFAMSVVCSLGTVLFGRFLTPFLMDKDRDAAEKSAVERMEQRKGESRSVR